MLTEAGVLKIISHIRKIGLKNDEKNTYFFSKFFKEESMPAAVVPSNFFLIYIYKQLLRIFLRTTCINPNM